MIPQPITLTITRRRLLQIYALILNRDMLPNCWWLRTAKYVKFIE